MAPAKPGPFFIRLFSEEHLAAGRTDAVRNRHVRQRVVCLQILRRQRGPEPLRPERLQFAEKAVPWRRRRRHFLTTRQRKRRRRKDEYRDDDKQRVLYVLRQSANHFRLLKRRIAEALRLASKLNARGPASADPVRHRYGRLVIICIQHKIDTAEQFNFFRYNGRIRR